MIYKYEEVHNDKRKIKEKVKEYSITNRDTELYCHYMISDYEYDYAHIIPLSEVEDRDLFIKNNNLKVFQKWFEYSIYQEPNDLNCHEIFVKTSKKILDHFYPKYEINYSSSGQFTLYEDGHFIGNHVDGNNPGRVCVVIIYLSHESEYNDDGGGELVIKTNSQKEYTIKPILGTFSLLDFSESDVHHQVNMVKNGFKRYAFINFFNAKEGQKFKTKKMLL